MSVSNTRNLTAAMAVATTGLLCVAAGATGTASQQLVGGSGVENGKVLLSRLGGTGELNGLFTVERNGSKLRRLKAKRCSQSANPLVARDADYSPSGKKIVAGFRQCGIRDLESQIAIMRGDGSHKRVIFRTGIRSAALQPEFSPDGNRVAFVHVHGSQSDLVTLRTNGTGLRQLVSVSGRDIQLESPSWSPNGRRIAFASFEDDGNAIETVSVDGSKRRTVLAQNDAPGDALLQAPAYAPDGKRIAFTARQWPSKSKGQVLTIRPDGSRLRSLRGTNGASIPAVHYAPRGDRILFTRFTGRASDGDPLSQACTVKDKGGDRRCLTKRGKPFIGLSWRARR